MRNLIARNDLGGLLDAEALSWIGELVDRSLDARSEERLTSAPPAPMREHAEVLVTSRLRSLRSTLGRP